VDLVAIADLLLAGCEAPVAACGEPLIELAAWVAHRRRRGEVRTATKNQLLTQVENDIVLGTSAYRNGTRATIFAFTDKGIFYLAGEGQSPRIVRGFGLDARPPRKS
jgi:hypothetical protein